MWTTEIPTESGYYWFYGDPHSERPQPEYYKISLVEMKITKGRPYGLFITEGNFMENKKGYWMKAILPELPLDTELNRV